MVQGMVRLRPKVRKQIIITMPIIKIELSEDEKIVLRQLLDTNLKSFIGLPNNEETVNKFKEEVHKIFEEFIGPVSTNLVNLVMDQYEAIIRKEISNYFINGTTS